MAIVLLSKDCSPLFSSQHASSPTDYKYGLRLPRGRFRSIHQPLNTHSTTSTVHLLTPSLLSTYSKPQNFVRHEAQLTSQREPEKSNHALYQKSSCGRARGCHLRYDRQRTHDHENANTFSFQGYQHGKRSPLGRRLQLPLQADSDLRRFVGYEDAHRFSAVSYLHWQRRSRRRIMSSLSHQRPDAVQELQMDGNTFYHRRLSGQECRR